LSCLATELGSIRWGATPLDRRLAVIRRRAVPPRAPLAKRQGQTAQLTDSSGFRTPLPPRVAQFSFPAGCAAASAGPEIWAQSQRLLASASVRNPSTARTSALSITSPGADSSESHVGRWQISMAADDPQTIVRRTNKRPGTDNQARLGALIHRRPRAP